MSLTRGPHYIDVAKNRLLKAWKELDKDTKQYIVFNNLIKDFEER